MALTIARKRWEKRIWVFSAKSNRTLYTNFWINFIYSSQRCYFLCLAFVRAKLNHFLSLFIFWNKATYACACPFILYFWKAQLNPEQREIKEKTELFLKNLVSYDPEYSIHYYIYASIVLKFTLQVIHPYSISFKKYISNLSVIIFEDLKNVKCSFQRFLTSICINKHFHTIS